MNRATHLCANPDCTHREWEVETEQDHVWILRGHGRFTLAAHEPFCPRCSSPLLEIASIETVDLEPVEVERYR